MDQYIPDMTERFPEGMNGIDLTDSYFPSRDMSSGFDLEDMNFGAVDYYHCDGCGEEIPYTDMYWFTSSIGFCRKCYEKLDKIPRDVRYFCYDECDAANNDVARWIIDYVKEN